MGLEIRQLNKTFGSRHAVKNLNIHLEEGNILGLLGRNGAGKTTTIRMILNIVKPDSGSILWKGKPFSRKEISFGYLPEERGLYPKMNVLEQLVYLSRLEGVPAKIAKKQALYWLERLDMTFAIKKKTEELSKGNQQKIQLISAILHDPDFIILDEPFSGLDPVNAEMLKSVVKELIKNGKRLFFAAIRWTVSRLLRPSLHYEELEKRSFPVLCQTLRKATDTVMWKCKQNRISARFWRKNIQYERSGKSIR